MLKDKRVWIIAAYLFIAVYLLPMYPHGGSANELTRWATAASLVETRSLEISWTEPLIGPNVDTARVGDRTYSNKAPGPALLGAPIYAIARIFVGPPDASNIRVTWFAMRFVLSTLPLLVLAVWMFRREADALSLTMLLFATPLFLYSLLFFSHLLVAVAIYAAFRLIFDEDKGKTKHLAMAGFLSGLAVISEFPAVFPVFVFAAGLLMKGKDRWRDLLYFVSGGMPFVIFLLLYNNALFGSPLSMSYAHESFPEWAEVAGQGIFGIGMPSPANAYLLLLSPARGLLFVSPILVLSLIVFVRKFDRKNIRSTVRLAAVVLGVLIICGHGAAHGGWAYGPRYLIFIIPFLLDPFFEGETREFPPVLIGGLLSASILLNVVPSLTFPFAPPEFTFPHNDFWMSFLRDESWAVPNLANVFGVASGLSNLLPLLVAFAIVAYAAIAGVKDPKRFGLGALAGGVVVGIYLFAPIPVSDENALRRASIAERYFKPTRRVDEYMARAESIKDPPAMINVRLRQWNVADARAYAPDDFPYGPKQPLVPSPTALMKAAQQYQKQQKIREAETALKMGEDTAQFARCEFSTNLAVLYFTTNRKDEALSKLESVQPFVNAGSAPDCMRSQYLLGTLYEEMGRVGESGSTFFKFLGNSAESKDPSIMNFRKQLLARQQVAK